MMSSILVRLLGPAMGFDSFRSYWFGTLASVTGFQMLTFTQFWLIHRLTEDPIFLGYVGLANAAPAIVLNLFGGVVADRIDRKRLIAITQFTNGLLILILGTLTITNIVSSSHVIAIAFLAGGVNAFDQPARQALYPSLIERSAMSNAVALNSTIWMSNRIIAPALAGFIIAWGGEGVSFLLSSAGFFVMVFVVMTLEVRKSTSHSKRLTESKGLLPEDSGLFGVIKFLAANNIFLILISMTFFNSFFGMAYIPMMPVFAKDILHVGSDGQGVLVGISGTGALAMSLLLGRIGTVGRTRLLLIVGSVLFGLTLTVFSLTSLKYEHYYLAMIFMLIMGLSNSAYLISIMSTIQLLVPDSMRGRVMGFHGMTFSIMPLGAMYAGGLSGFFKDASVGVASTVAFGGVLVAVFSIACGLLNSNVKGIDNLIRKHQENS